MNIPLNSTESKENQNTQKNNLFLSTVMIPHLTPLSSTLPSSSQFQTLNDPHFQSYGSSQTAYNNEYSLTASSINERIVQSPISILEKLITQEILPLLKLISLQDIIINLFPTPIPKKSKTKNKYTCDCNYNILYHIFFQFKNNCFINNYKVSSQFYLLSGLLKNNIQLHQMINKFRMKKDKKEKERNSAISTPSSTSTSHFNTPTNSLFSFPIASSNPSLISQASKNENEDNSIKSWFLFCNFHLRDIFLNYFSIDVRYYIYLFICLFVCLFFSFEKKK